MSYRSGNAAGANWLIPQVGSAWRKILRKAHGSGIPAIQLEWMVCSGLSRCAEVGIKLNETNKIPQNTPLGKFYTSCSETKRAESMDQTDLLGISSFLEVILAFPS